MHSTETILAVKNPAPPLTAKTAIKRVVKRTSYAFIFLLVLPSGLLARAARRLLGTEMVFGMFAEAFSLIPNLPGIAVRACYYKQVLRKSHLDLAVGFGSVVTRMGAEIGPNVIIGGRTTIGLARIAEFAAISNNVSLLSGRRPHNFADPETNILSRDHVVPIHVGRNTFIGERSVVMADVGERAVVGAGSVVLKPVGDLTLVAGNPARFIRRRTIGESQS